MVVSSANMVDLDISFIMPGKSLMYRRKNKGPKIEPCVVKAYVMLKVNYQKVNLNIILKPVGPNMYIATR